MVHDIECEKAVLGIFLTSHKEFVAQRENLNEECFYEPKNQLAFKYICQIDQRGDIPDIVTLTAETLKHKDNYLSPIDILEFTANVTTTIGIDAYVKRLVELYQRRNLLSVGYKLQQASQNELEPIAETIKQAKTIIDNSVMMKNDNIITLGQTIKELCQLIKDNKDDTKPPNGTSTGFSILDVNGGLHPTDLAIVAAESSQGKTSFALSIVLNAITNGDKVAFYSLEMTRLQLTSRLVAMRSGVPSSSILYKRLNDYDENKVGKGMKTLPFDNLYFDDRSTSNIDNILMSIRSMVLKYNIKGAVIDYLQILNVNMKGANQAQIMGDVSRRLKNIAKDLNIWIIALSQLARDRENPQPSVSRLRSSGEILEACDYCMLIYRPEVYGKTYPKGEFRDKDTHNTAMIDMAKGRNTGIKKCICNFQPEITLFYEGEINNLPTEDMPF